MRLQRPTRKPSCREPCQLVGGASVQLASVGSSHPASLAGGTFTNFSGVDEMECLGCVRTKKQQLYAQNIGVTWMNERQRESGIQGQTTDIGEGSTGDYSLTTLRKNEAKPRVPQST